MKKLVIIVTLLYVMPILSQNNKATLHFKDGTEISGLAKITTYGDKIKFRKDKNSEKSTYTSEELKSIEIHNKKIQFFGKRTKPGYVHYYYKKIKTQGSPLLLEILEEGKVKLFLDYKQSTSAPMMGANGTMTGGGTYTINSYYVSKNDDEIVTHLGDRGNLFSKNFKKAASEYFKDCSRLVKKIQDKEFRKRDIIKVVKFYNEDCQYKFINKKEDN